MDPDIPMSEDCLYLNIWTGAGKENEKLPVLVWFFGGGLQCGYTAEMEFDGERLARRGIVVVSVNYRVNVFGFLAHPQLTSQQPDAPANFGSLDQQAGLRWVLRNIAAFGGDPENVTIAGQSAGGGSVLSQMTCPDNFGMFQKAVIMSAMIRSPYEEGGVRVPQPLWEAEENGQHFFGFLGVSCLEEARKLDAAFMAGNTSDEFLNFIPADSEEELEERAKELFGEEADTFLAFPESRRRDERRGYAGVSGTECTIKGIFANEKGEHGERYYYRFDPDIPGWDQPGTFHSSDLWFFFETLAKCWRPFVGHHYDLARKMCTYWVNFIKTGNPNGLDADGSALEEWRPYTKENPCGMAFESAGPRALDGEETGFASFLTDRIIRSMERGKVWQDG